MTHDEQRLAVRQELHEAREAVREIELAKPLEQIVDEVLARSRSFEPVEEKPAQVVRAYARRGPLGITSFLPPRDSSNGNWSAGPHNSLGVPK